jgi:hypothetical protein
MAQLKNSDNIELNVKKSDENNARFAAYLFSLTTSFRSLRTGSMPDKGRFDLRKEF